MPTTKLPAITSGTITIGGVDFEISSGEITLNKEDIEYTPMTGNSLAYAVQIPGGKVSAEGSIEAAWDTTKSGTGDFPAPFTPDALASAVVNVGAKALSFDCMVQKLSIKKGESGVVSMSCDYKSSGTITYS